MIYPNESRGAIELWSWAGDLLLGVVEDSKKVTKGYGTFDRIIDATAYIAFGLLVFSWVSVCAEVVFRYFLKQPIIWVVEVTEYIMVQITFVGSAWLLRKEGHVTVDVVTSRLSKRNQTLLLAVTSAICVVTFVIITGWAVVATWGAYREHLYIPKQLDMPKFLVMLVIPFGSFMVAGQFLRRTLSAIRTWRSLRRKEGD